jgi:3',5'-cyclic AMP phosphodiesterase CpdA
VRIAHISDLHVIALEGAVPFRLLNKRLTGYVNLKLIRSPVHLPALARAVVREIRRHEVDHVVVTGDLTNLALEGEFERARALLAQDLGASPSQVSVVPGNHDVYTRGARRSRRFERYFEAYATSDLPELAGDAGCAPFPFVRVRGPAAIIGLCSAVPRPPLMASGVLGAEQRAALARILEHPEVQRRTPIVLQHHPLINPPTFTKTVLEGLWDAAAETALLSQLRRVVVLHGHLHRRIRRTLDTACGRIEAIGSTSASLRHETPARMAGYNLLELDETGALRMVTSFRINPDTYDFEPADIPTEAASARTLASCERRSARPGSDA